MGLTKQREVARRRVITLADDTLGGRVKCPIGQNDRDDFADAKRIRRGREKAPRVFAWLAMICDFNQKNLETLYGTHRPRGQGNMSIRQAQIHDSNTICPVAVLL